MGIVIATPAKRRERGSPMAQSQATRMSMRHCCLFSAGQKHSFWRIQRQLPSIWSAEEVGGVCNRTACANGGSHKALFLKLLVGSPRHRRLSRCVGTGLAAAGKLGHATMM